MPKAIIIEEFGGPEVMQMIESQTPPPNNHEVTIRNTAIGLNFIDTYNRSVLYTVEFPIHLCLEGSAVFTDLGKDVHVFDFRANALVAFCVVEPSARREIISANGTPADPPREGCDQQGCGGQGCTRCRDEEHLNGSMAALVSRPRGRCGQVHIR